jgi:hypothetical protein
MADEPSPERAAVVEEAGRAIRAARGPHRDELLEAHRALSRAERLHDRAAIVATGALLRRLGGVVEDDEEVLDLAPGVSAGHEGVLAATDRRLLFLAPRLTLAFPYEDVTRIGVRGRWFRSSLAVATDDASAVIAGLRPQRAAELDALVRSRAAGVA